MSKALTASQPADEPQRRLTELLMAISLAADLVAGQPFGQTLSASLLSASLADEMGCTPNEAQDTLQVSLLYFIGLIGPISFRRQLAFSPPPMSSSRHDPLDLTAP